MKHSSNQCFLSSSLICFCFKFLDYIAKNNRVGRSAFLLFLHSFSVFHSNVMAGTGVRDRNPDFKFFFVEKWREKI